MRKYKLPYPPNYNEPYFARYVKSWRKPPKYNSEIKQHIKPLQHCKACSRTCDYYFDDPGLCPFYDMQ